MGLQNTTNMRDAIRSFLLGCMFVVFCKPTLAIWLPRKHQTIIMCTSRMFFVFCSPSLQCCYKETMILTCKRRFVIFKSGTSWSFPKRGFHAPERTKTEAIFARHNAELSPENMSKAHVSGLGDIGGGVTR